MRVVDDDEIHVDRVRTVLRNIAHDDRLAFMGAEVRLLSQSAHSATELASRLRELHARYASNLDGDLAPPARSLAKVVDLATFLRWYTRPDVRAEYEHQRLPEDFLPRVAGRSDAEVGSLLFDLLSPEPQTTLIEAARSWLIPVNSIIGRTATTLIAELRIPHCAPPLVAMVLKIEDLNRDHIHVRRPTGLDTVPRLDDVWLKDAVVGELIDGDVLRKTCSSVRWIA